MKYKKLVMPTDNVWDRPEKWYDIIGKLKSFMFDYRNTKIYNFLDLILFTPYYNISNGLVNIYNWLPIIWKDRNWDYRYIYTILEKKLELTREEIVSSNRHQDIDDNENKYITICLNLIDKVSNEDYGCEYFDYLKEEMNFIPYKKEVNDLDDELFEGEDPEQEYLQMETKVLENNLDEYFKLRPAAYKRFLKTDKGKNIDKGNDRYLAIMFSDYNQERAKKLLFKVLANKISSWWD